MDIERNARRYLGDRFASWERVAVTFEQIGGLAVDPRPGNPKDSRAKAFVKKHGQLIQVEVEALDPNVLRRLIQARVDEHWDASASEAVEKQEHVDRELLKALADNMTA
jgi:hypothetical protein